LDEAKFYLQLKYLIKTTKTPDDDTANDDDNDNVVRI
jgi:hypothetical protein